MARQLDTSWAGGGEAANPGRRATTVSAEGRLVLAESGGHSCLLLYLAGHYVHRIDRERRELYFGDLYLAVVAESIAMAAIEPGMRDPAFRTKHASLDSIVGVEGQRGINATSIANATGMPRETVRRKLKRLLELGFIVEKGRARYVLTPGVLQRPERQAAIGRGIQRTLQFVNECLEQGVLRWESERHRCRRGRSAS